MTITENLMAAGSWSLNLKPDTPQSVRKYLDPTAYGFSLLIVTATRVDPTAFSAASLRGLATYIGVTRDRPTDDSIAGAGLPILLGDENGKGPQNAAGVTLTAATLTTWVNALLPQNGVILGTITNTGTPASGTYQYVNTRAVLNAACSTVGAEWRIYPSIGGNLLLDAGPQSALFPTTTTPTAIVTRQGGRDPAITGIEASTLATNTDVQDFQSGLYLIARGNGAATVAHVTNGTIPYYSPGGSQIVMDTVVDSPQTQPGDATSVATALLNKSIVSRKQITLSTAEYNFSSSIEPGDTIFIYDPLIGLYDVANQITYRGVTINPVKQRCVGSTWPIRDGMGVYLQTSEASPVIVDLSNWFVPETGDTTVTIGATLRTLGDNTTAAVENIQTTGALPTAISTDALASWSPTVTAGAGVTFTNLSSKISYIGKRVTVSWSLTLTGGGTAGNVIILGGLPTRASNDPMHGGSASYWDAANWWALVPSVNTSTSIGFLYGNNAAFFGQTPAITVANTHIFRGSITYETA